MRRKSGYHWILALAVLSLPLAVSAEAATNCGSPGANQAIVWEHDNFVGNCDVLEIGSYPYAAVNAMSVGNDTISSVKVGSNVKVTLYENDLPGTGPGDWMPLITSRSVVSDFNDTTSAIRVESRFNCPAPGPSQVVVAAGFNFSGHCDVLDFGFPVTYAKILGLSVGNDEVSSVVCGSSSSLLLWEHDLNGGSSAQTAKACSINAFEDFNNTASSLIVQMPPPTDCSGNQGCSAGDFCDLPSGSNACFNLAGTCTIQPTICSSAIAPSCGCDGRSYANDCEREAAGVPKWSDGTCSSPSCPGTTPQPGSSCTAAGISCVYVGPDAGCVQRMTCTNGHWSDPTVTCGF